MPRVQQDEKNETLVQNNPTFASIVGEGTPNTVPAGSDVDDDAPAQRQYTTTPDLDRSKMSIPRLRLAQGNTPEIGSGLATQGQWILLGDKGRNEVTFIPYAYNFSRAYRPVIDAAPACVSPDGVKGIGNPGVLCKVCPHSQWTNNDGARKPPACSEVYSYMGYSVEHDSVCTLDLRGTAVRTAQEINMQIAYKRFGNFALALSSEQKQNPKRQVYFVPKAKAVDVPPEHISQLRELMVLVGHPIDQLPQLPEANPDDYPVDDSN